ncbi:secreted frizzled-related protein [Schistosoma mansoni]|uniref:secreted frizzled-related protein n=1 Tax=Schistosoma mansoni TaxID=6183 RepID=UPI0001A61C61|nr:secreted frizzled-related protein [Schistosoma mansoni]|eukprot:XP_018647391.1 secreted frizzled-related protein [Schistosoma mansoni]
MFLIHQYIFLTLYFSSYIYCIGRGFFKSSSSNSYHEWNPSNRLPSSSSIRSSTSLSSSASISSILSPLSYSSDTNSYAYWNCHTIPPNMTLCKSVGYSRMVLPNFLNHESLREAIQQANVWIALVNTDCHPDIQRFLCSLYAPICLKSHQESKIPPCWELCNQVRNSCLPRMKLFGYDWPDIVNCQQFPRLVESMCIPPQEKSTVLKASIKDMILQPNQASIIFNLTPRTLALKLIRNDGTQLSSIDQYRRKRNSRRRRNHQFNNNNQNDQVYQLRTIRDLKNSKYKHINNQYQSNYMIKSKSINVDEGNHWKSEHKSKMKRRRKPRNSRLHDLDGITELILSCSSCNPLLPFTNGRLISTLSNQKWLIMGRRIQNSNTKKYTNQLQVTFLGLWNRESIEFRQSLNAIRKESITQLCNKNQPSLSNLIQSQTIQHHHSGRPLKILRSAPSELSDSFNYYNQMNKPFNVNKQITPSLSNVNVKTKLGNFNDQQSPLITNHNTTNSDHYNSSNATSSL